MFCNNCGANVIENAQFCGECGSKIVKETIVEATEVLNISGTCKNCGAETNPDGRFCGECGTPVNSSANVAVREAINQEDISHTEKKETKKKENLAPFFITLVIVTIVCGGLIWYMLDRASTPISIELPNIEETESDIDEDDDFDEEKVNTRSEAPAVTAEPVQPVAEPEQLIEYDIAVEEPETDYLFPSHIVYITEEDLDDLTKEEITLIRNEIYARHGYIFQKEPYKSYFSERYWYTPNEAFSESSFSEIEKANLDTITAYEQKMGWR